jgi:hypothetical protein
LFDVSGCVVGIAARGLLVVVIVICFYSLRGLPMRVVSRVPGGVRTQRYLEIEQAMLTQSGNEDHPCGKR